MCNFFQRGVFIVYFILVQYDIIFFLNKNYKYKYFILSSMLQSVPRKTVSVFRSSTDTRLPTSVSRNATSVSGFSRRRDICDWTPDQSRAEGSQLLFRRSGSVSNLLALPSVSLFRSFPISLAITHITFLPFILNSSRNCPHHLPRSFPSPNLFPDSTISFRRFSSR